jgi:hypothetical protein
VLTVAAFTLTAKAAFAALAALNNMFPFTFVKLPVTENLKFLMANFTAEPSSAGVSCRAPALFQKK